jgi:hypothetical protein
MFDKTLSFFKVLAARRPQPHLLVINRSEHHATRAAVERAGIAADGLELIASEHYDVPGLIARTDFTTAVMEAAADRLLVLVDDQGIGPRCVDTAQRLFSLEGGVEVYRAIYESPTGGPEMVGAPTGGWAQTG